MAEKQAEVPPESEVNIGEVAPEVVIDLSDPSISEFKRAFEGHYQKFCEALADEYLKIKREYTEAMDKDFEEVHKMHKEEYEERNQQISALGEDLQFKQRRMNHLLDTIDNFIKLKYERICVRKVLDKWREMHKEKHKVMAHDIYADNYAKRRLMHKCFVGWRKETHAIKKRLIEQEFAFKVEELKAGKLASYDRRIREVLTKIEAAKRILAEEVAVKDKLTAQYEQALGRGVNVLSRETNIISSNPLIAELSFVQGKSMQEGAQSVSQTPARPKYVSGTGPFY